MSTIPQKILVPFSDDERSINAMAYAAMLASNMGAAITALHLADTHDYTSKKEFQEELKEMVDQRLRPKLREIQKSYPDIRSIRIQTLGLEKSIDQHIIDFAKEEAIDFIVMRSHGLPEASELELRFKKTNAYKVALEAPCPVFTFTGAPVINSPKHILLPLDLSDGSLYKAPLAMELAKKFGATVHLLSASEHIEDHEELDEQITTVSEELTNRGIEVVTEKIHRKTLIEAIEDYTEKVSIDLITIMSRPGFRWSDLWMSPGAKKIIAQSKVPVLSVRTKGPIEVGI